MNKEIDKQFLNKTILRMNNSLMLSRHRYNKDKRSREMLQKRKKLSWLATLSIPQDSYFLGGNTEENN